MPPLPLSPFTAHLFLTSSTRDFPHPPSIHQKIREENEKLIFLRAKLENARRRKDEHDRHIAEEAARARAAEEDERKRQEADEKRMKIDAKIRAAEEDAAMQMAAVMASGRADTASSWRNGPGAASGPSAGGAYRPGAYGGAGSGSGVSAAAASSVGPGGERIVDGIRFGAAPPRINTGSNWRERAAAREGMAGGGGAGAPPPSAAVPGPAAGGPPRVVGGAAPGGGGGGWREREASRGGPGPAAGGGGAGGGGGYGGGGGGGGGGGWR